MYISCLKLVGRVGQKHVLSHSLFMICHKTQRLEQSQFQL